MPKGSEKLLTLQSNLQLLEVIGYEKEHCIYIGFFHSLGSYRFHVLFAKSYIGIGPKLV